MMFGRRNISTRSTNRQRLDLWEGILLGQSIQKKAHINIEDGRYCVRVMVPWFSAEFSGITYTPIEGYGHTVEAAWSAFEYWWEKLMGEPYSHNEHVW